MVVTPSPRINQRCNASQPHSLSSESRPKHGSIMHTISCLFFSTARISYWPRSAIFGRCKGSTAATTTTSTNEQLMSGTHHRLPWTRPLAACCAACRACPNLRISLFPGPKRNQYCPSPVNLKYVIVINYHLHVSRAPANCSLDAR